MHTETTTSLRELRLGARLSQASLAERAGLSQSRVSRIETGLAEPSAAELHLLCEACRVEVEARYQWVLQTTKAPTAQRGAGA